VSHVDPSEVARFFQQYAKRYSAGAFATPTAKDIATHPLLVRDWRGGGGRTVAFMKRLTRPSVRKDWTGQEFVLGAGATVATHVAREPGAVVPSGLLEEADYLFTYVEDEPLTQRLVESGREPVAVRITAASEIIYCWGFKGEGKAYPEADLVTFRELQISVSTGLLACVQRELAMLSGWDDDYPFYSDGSWGQLSLRGFDASPQWGLKPSEMPQKWKDENPDALSRKCGWTELATVCPGLTELSERVAQGQPMERVRLMRMFREGKTARLRRHTDITDRNAGIRDGAISRLHFPLVTYPSVRFHCWELDGRHRDEHMAKHRLYYMDQRKPHAVTNESGRERIHLTVDVVSDFVFRGRINP
jgi:hypothetical protein